jgi:hypothetical protein
MQDVTITFTDGLLKGRNFDFEVGRVPIGRLPGPGGLELKGADASVSRLHAELVERGADIELKNLSPNGTYVDGKLVLDTALVHSGALVEIGDDHPFKVHWSSVGATQAIATKAAKKAPTKRATGPLASPVIRAVIGVYLLGIIGVAIWLKLDSSAGATSDEWPALAASYDGYEVANADAKPARAARAEELVRKLRVAKIRGAQRDVESICRELMSVDGDVKSPLFQYGARCLGAAQGALQ